MTKMEILALVEELEKEYGKTQRVPHYYMRKGQMVERSYPDYIYTERYMYLISDKSPLSTEKVFIDAETGKTYAYADLEEWCCDFENDHYISMEEYEDEMGEDL